MTASDFDLNMMQRCIDLSAAATAEGELPFAALVCRGTEVVAEATNRVVRDVDVSRHAELVVLTAAQAALGRRTLPELTLYTTVEPCPMCSFSIRETRIGRVVYALNSPVMGGLSKWNVLGDEELSDTMPVVFGSVPEVVGGVLHREAAAVWHRWNPLIWALITHRGLLTEPPDGQATRMQQSAKAPGLLRALLRARPSLASIRHAIRIALG